MTEAKAKVARERGNPNLPPPSSTPVGGFKPIIIKGEPVMPRGPAHKRALESIRDTHNMKESDELLMFDLNRLLRPELLLRPETASLESKHDMGETDESLMSDLDRLLRPKTRAISSASDAPPIAHLPINPLDGGQSNNESFTTGIEDETKQNPRDKHMGGEPPMVNQGSAGLPGVEGGQRLHIDYTGDTINFDNLDMEVADNLVDDELKHEVTIHSELGGDITGGSGDVMSLRDLGEQQAHEALSYTFEQFTNDFGLLGYPNEDQYRYAAARGIFFSDSAHEQERQAMDILIDNAPSEFKDEVEAWVGGGATARSEAGQIKMLRRRRANNPEDRRSLMPNLKRLGRTYVDPTKNVLNVSSQEIQEQSGASTEAIRQPEAPWKPNSSRYRTNQVGLVRNAAKSYLNDVTALLPTV